MSIEEKYDEVRQLINIGKEKGYLLYDEVNELLPSEITSSDELDDLFNTFGSAGIEVVDSDQKKFRDDKPLDRTAEGAEELELDLTPGRARQDQRSRPHVPARDGHRAAAHARRRSRDRPAHRARQARGHQVDLAHADRRRSASSSWAMSSRTTSGRIRELVTFTDEELTDDKIDERKREVLRQIDAVRKARVGLREGRGEARADTAERHATSGSTAASAGRRCARASSCRSASARSSSPRRSSAG